VASFSERRTYNVVGPHDWDIGPNRLPLFLAPQPGLNSGYMIAQYVAAALVNEIKVLAHPASIDSIPTSAGMEDFVSMGATAALKLRQQLDLAFRVVAVELLCAAQGLDFRRPLRAGSGVEQAHQAVRRVVPHLDEDRPPAPDIEALAEALRAGLLEGLAPETALDTSPPKRSHRANGGGSRRAAADAGDAAGTARH
jgi:histidine ammonia-lyase